MAVQPALRVVPRFIMVNSLRMNTRVVTTDYKQLIRESILHDEGFIKATFSGQHRDRTVGAGNVGARVVRCGGVGPCGCPGGVGELTSARWKKVIVRPVLVRGKKHTQFSYFDAKKDITKNYQGDESAEMLEQLIVLVAPAKWGLWRGLRARDSILRR